MSTPSLAKVEDWLAPDEALTPAESATLQLLLDRTVDMVSRELDWYFGEPRAAVEVKDGTGHQALWLRQYIVDNTLAVQTRSGVGEDWKTVDASEYEYEVGGRGIFSTGTWTRGLRNYRVSYQEGFATMPGDVEQLILDLVATRWNNRDNDPGLKSETIGDYSYTREDLEKMHGWAAVWAHWKRGRI